jgi:hypothetical protein
MSVELIFESYPGWDTTHRVWRENPEYKPSYSPACSDAAKNFAHEVWLMNNPDIELPYAKHVYSIHEPIDGIDDPKTIQDMNNG